jgi:phenylacetate-CoA ligase
MSDALLQLYHRLPSPVRSIAASVRGLGLRSWRYGPESDRLVTEARDREHWGVKQWEVWQEENLGRLLDRAVKQVPYYRELWAERRRKGDRSSWEYLENWPILEKESLRENPESFIADDSDRRAMKHIHTSGTTGKSLDLWRSKSTERAWYALFEARCRRWYGISRHERWAILGGQLVTPVQRRRPPFWVWNAALNQLYMSSYHLAPDLLPHYLDALSRYRIDYLYGYSSSLYELAQESLRQGRDDLKMTVALTNAEPVFAYQRAVIERAFQCSVRETYGMAEIVAAASECQHRRLHLWPDVGHIEIVSDGLHRGSGRAGELVSTGLVNMDMPLIRYRVGDCVTLPSTSGPCECGRTLPLLASIDGRLDDVIFTTDGRRIGRLDPVFKTELPIREAQIIQESLDHIRVKYVPAIEFSTVAAELLVARLRAHLGNVQVTLERVDEVPRTANGKFRAVISKLPEATRRALVLPPAA